MSGRSIAKTSLLLLPVQITFRGGEAILPLLLAAWFGRSTQTDVYYFAWAVFTFAGSLVFSAYQDSALVPILAELKTHDREEVPNVTGSLLLHTIVFGGLLALAIGGVAAGWFAWRYEGEAWSTAWKMVPLFSAYLVLLSLKTFFSAILNADHRYFAFPIASAVGMVATIALMATLRHSLGVVAIPLGQMVGELVAATGLALVTFGPLKMKMRLSLSRPPAVRRFFKLIASEVGGSAVTRINPVVDQLMAGIAGVVGGGTLLRLSSDVSTLPTSLLQASLLPVLLSHLSEDHAAGRLRSFRRTVLTSLGVVMALLVLATAILYGVRLPLLKLVFLRGEMDLAGVERMAGVFVFHVAGLAPFGALLLFARAHVAMKNSPIMLKMGAINALLNVVFNVVFVKLIGLEGIALSTSAVHLAIALIFYVKLEQKLKAPGAEASA